MSYHWQVIRACQSLANDAGITTQQALEFWGLAVHAHHLAWQF